VLMMGEETETNKCRNCAHSEVVKNRETGHEPGFVRCSLLPRWQWISASSKCCFAPSRHEQRAPMFVVRNNKRTADLTVSTGAQLITLLYAFGNTRGVEWSDPKWKAEMEFYEQEHCS
jgi:hypothetical protein